MLISQEIYHQISQLPALEKLHLAEKLLADLDTPNPEIDKIWTTEAEKRLLAYQSGQLSTVDYETVMQKYR
ncbi:MAG: addiction module protein [Methylomonas sp.]